MVLFRDTVPIFELCREHARSHSISIRFDHSFPSCAKFKKHDDLNKTICMNSCLKKIFFKANMDDFWQVMFI